MNLIARAYDRYCTTRFPLPTENEVAALEERLKIDFPDDYREYLLQYNGGYFRDAQIVFPEPITVRWRDGSVTHTDDHLTVMYGVDSNNKDRDIAQPFRLHLLEDNDPLQLLPIGYTSVGCLVLLDLAPGYIGNVLLKFPSADAYTVTEGIADFFGLIK